MGLVSIIIPVFNREKFLTETIDSVIKQTYPNWELLLVDDGSTDRSIQIAQEFANKDTRIKSIQRDRTPKGAPTCRNIGLERATGEYIQFFDSDDLMFATAIHDKINELLRNQSLEFVVSRTEYMRPNGDMYYPDQRFIYPSSFEEYLRNNTLYLTPGPLLRLEFIKKFNLKFDESLTRHQDFEYFCRLMSLNPKFEFLDKYHHVYRLHSNNIMSAFKSKGNYKNFISKLKAVHRLNINTNFKHRSVIKRIFLPLATTTFKVALFSCKPIDILNSIYWWLKLRFL